MIEPKHSELSITCQCPLLSLNRATYYASCRLTYGVEDDFNIMLMNLIDEEYTRHPFYGTRKMVVYLRNVGYPVNRKRVQRLMRKMGIQSVAPKPNTSKARKGHKIYPYRLAGLDINHAHQVWSTDITYIRMAHGFVYLVAIIDLYSRQVLAWEVSVTMEDSFCVSALERALRLFPKPDIFNTDQGAQFTGNSFTGVLKAHGIKISMDGKGRALDNIFIERLWRSVKYEEIYLNEYQNVSHLKQSLKKYFHFYNTERPHQSLEYRTPVEFNRAATQLPVAASI
jgi:putative transposase